MKRKILRNFFHSGSIFSILMLSVILQFSCSPKKAGGEATSPKYLSLKKMQLQYGAYDFDIATRFVKGKMHLNYIDRDNYWEFGIWNGDSVNVVKFNGAFYKELEGKWQLYASYDSFDLPDYLKLIFPDKNVTPGGQIKFKPNPVIVQSMNASGEIGTNGNKFYNLRITGTTYNARLTLLRMLPVLPQRFQTTISITGFSPDDSKILYRRTKNLHPMIYKKGNTTIIRIQGYMDRKLFEIIAGKGEIAIFPVSYAPTPGYKMINLGNNEQLFYKKVKEHFKITKFRTEGNSIITELSDPVDQKAVYGLFIDNNFVGIGRANGMEIRFAEYVITISSYINPIISNGYITSKIVITNFIDPSNRR